MANDVRLSIDRLDSATGKALASAHLAEMETRYGAPDYEDGIHADQLTPPHGAFLVAWLGTDPVGCGGIRRVDEHVAEIKRMYVRPDARRRGVAHTVLVALEESAREVGYGRLVLETGILQPEAIALYETHGFEPMTPYGAYADDPMSRCYTKVL